MLTICSNICFIDYIEKRRDSFKTNINGILSIVFDSKKNVTCYVSSNVLVTSIAFNLFYGAYSKIILLLLNIFY